MQIYSDEELAAFEHENSVSLPLALRNLLQFTGAGDYDNVEIYRPEDIGDLYRPFFDDPSELFRIYLPFGESKVEQEMLVCRVGDGTYASIWHETVPDDWPEEHWQPLTAVAIDAIVNGG